MSGTGVGSNGAIVNSGGTIGDSSGGLTPTLVIAGNTTLSYPTRWDLGSSTGAVLTNNGLGSSLTLVGPGANAYYAEWRDVKTDPTLANINVIGLALGIAGSTTLGNPTAALTITNNAGLKFYDDDGFNVSVNKLIVLQDGGLIQNGAGANAITGGLVLTNENGSQYCQMEINSGTSLTVNGPLTGNGILYMQGSSGILTINGGASALSGGALIPGGTFIVNNIFGSGVTNSSAGAVAGTGPVDGITDIGASFNPGPIGAGRNIHGQRRIYIGGIREHDGGPEFVHVRQQ